MGKLNMTMMAQEAMDIGDHLMLMFMKRTVGEDPKMRLDVAKPDGPSTEGGKKARQTISLVPVEGSGGKQMVGWLDVAQKRVEVRSHRVIIKQYNERYGTDMNVPQPEYDELVEALSGFLKGRGFNVVVKDDMPARRPAAQPVKVNRPGGAAAPAPVANDTAGPPWMWIAAAAAIAAFGVAIGAFLF